MMEKDTYSGFQTLNKKLYITTLGNPLLPFILMGYEIFNWFLLTCQITGLHRQGRQAFISSI